MHNVFCHPIRFRENKSLSGGDGVTFSQTVENKALLYTIKIHALVLGPSRLPKMQCIEGEKVTVGTGAKAASPVRFKLYHLR